jgi:membrane protein DedA with SNARE-associated domain
VALAFCGIPIPVPEDVMVMTVGWSMTTGTLSPLLVIPIVYLGVLTRDSFCYWGGRKFGGRVLGWLGEERVARSRAWIDREGRKTIFSARFVPALRIPIFAVAGATGMSPRDFYTVNAPTVALTMSIQLALGYFLGPQAIGFWNESPAFRVGLVCAALLFVVVLVVRARRGASEAT